jgi:tRNA pseudouridine38-40 synthase
MGCSVFGIGYSGLPDPNTQYRTPNTLPMRTMRATLEYDGTDFHGFQVQTGLPTVQQAVETKLARVTGETIRIAAAGRTDAGVHATGQVISFTTHARIPTDRLAIALNSLAPYSIVVREVREAEFGFHARYGATSRSYQYALLRGEPSPFLRRYAAWVPELQRVDRMEAAVRQVIGRHDFTSFCAAGAEVKRKVRTVADARLVERGRLLLFEITADGFLQQMVRTVVGTLLEVERGVREPDEIAVILAAQDRRRAGATAPAHGLCFTRATYM